MKICLLGQNHRTAPIEIRERLAFDEAKQRRLVEMMRGDDLHPEAAVLNTCNRVELYAVSAAPEASRERLGHYLEEIHEIELDRWRDTLYFREDGAAVRHLFEVASGLDSLILGEGQILSQVKSAYDYARERELARDVLSRAFLDAVHCGKRVRSDTKVGEGAVSVAYAAVSLARKIFGELSGERVLLLGAGETGQRVARHLQLFGVQNLAVSNRSRARGEELAAEMDATLVPWDAIDRELPQVSIVITATGATTPVLMAEQIEAALEKSQRRTLFCIDLAVPRDVEPKASDIPGVFLYNVDDLKGIVLEGEDLRRAEAAKAAKIVDEQVDEFQRWFRSRSVAPTIGALHAHVAMLRREELDAVRGTLSPESYAAVERVTHRLARKLLHEPTMNLKDLAQERGHEQVVEDLRRLFGLNGTPPRDADPE